MARFWFCVAGAGCFLALLVLHSRIRDSPVLREFVFQVSWRTENVLYRLDVGWPKHSEYFTGVTFCVAVDSLNGLVYIAQRGENIQKVLVFTEDGYFLRAWNYTVDTPHGMFATRTLHEQSIWITDVGSDFMVLWVHGENGTGPAKFNIPHSVTVDSAGRVWVADRGNRRIQVFDKDTGEWLGAWNNCFTEEGPSSVRFTPDWKYLIVAQLNLSRLLFVAAPPVGSIGYCSVISSIQLADQVLPHLLDISGKTGAIYVAEIGARQVQKYVPLNSYFRSFHS
ncbi:NHL repeat-containing protein 3 isoform X2 [Rousettus aegyptiacus]|uniref:NHL repeat containing 3 n=2 Tax=Rousettus aegyptiacus TaxID=9407 RepID=A0A7J8DYR3_ROUAE|nr:NHL repeat-containing protein 3 isoform X2 [Rousettus aegyptiacus]KAF6428159.1 NHL repeat containing 3 [Rousettus aegyptiacus]